MTCVNALPGPVSVRVVPDEALAIVTAPVVPEIDNLAEDVAERTRSPVPLDDRPVPVSPVNVMLGKDALPNAKDTGPTRRDAASNLLAIAVEIFPNSTS